MVDLKSVILKRHPTMVRYIHRNPLEAGLVKPLDQYVWLSHKGYISIAKKWSWLKRDRKFRQRLADIENNILKGQM